MSKSARADDCTAAAGALVCTTMSPKPFHQRAALRFACTGCGACCTGGVDHEVAVSRAERDAIRGVLGLSPAWFRRRYLARDPDGHTGIRLARDGRCPFLGADNRCRIYAVRPRQCRTYPWWPELLDSRRTWDAEAQRCEGINRGSVVPLARIERALERERRDERRARKR
jgi:hypothetical protein